MGQDFFHSFRDQAGRTFRRWAGAFSTLFAGQKPREGTDAEQVEAAARLLRVSDFEFFRIAYSCWYGRELGEKEAEKFFAGYLLRREVPFWVRHLSRKIREQHFRDELNPREFGVDGPPLHREDPSVKTVVGVLLGVIYFFFFLALAGYLSS